MTDLQTVYARRFTDKDALAKDRIWREIARYLQRYVPVDSVVLDVACDRGAFIKNIDAGQKWATDVRDVRGQLPPDIRFVQAEGLSLAQLLPRSHFDTVFMSNYLEHLPSGDAVVQQLLVARELLKDSGSVIVLQPNLRLIGERYWDFIDHKVPLTDRSLVEAAELAGFATEALVVRFLPYTTKSRLPRHPLLVRAYLAMRPAWLLLGKQTLFVGRKGALQ